MQNKRRRIQETCAECQFYEGWICTCPWSDQYSEYKTEVDTCDAWAMKESEEDNAIEKRLENEPNT